MRNDLSEVVLIVDRSGSMESCRIEAQNGINHFLESQKNDPGECRVTLVEFDNEYNFVFKGELPENIKPYTLVPRGMTALNDAVGKAIIETGARLAKMEEKDRPSLVTVVIVTDGGENASKEFRTHHIKEMIEHQEKVYNWKFTYLGANQDAFAVAGSLGIAPAAASNYVGNRSLCAFTGAANNVRRMKTASLEGATMDCSYTNEERKNMGDHTA